VTEQPKSSATPPAEPTASPQLSPLPVDRGGRVLQVPTFVLQKAASLGKDGEAWLAGLPERIAHLEARWSVTVGEALAGGSAAFVARVRTADGGDAVLKVALPDPLFRTQAQVLERARGRGYARLLGVDLEHDALLLESLGPSLEQLGMPAERQLEILCAMLTRAWEVPPLEEPTQTAVEAKARGLHALVDRLWVELGRPCPEAVVRQALRFAERRVAAAEPGRAVLVHGDPHPANALQVKTPRASAEAGFVFVDPDGFLAEPAYDLGVVLREWSSELLAGDAPSVARRYCQLLASHTGVEAQAIWEWGFLERVSSGLYALSFGAEELGRPFLTTAERLLD
jgi:streptomycin 6-kinase